jgi:ATP-dependent Lhr-like helicase
VPSAETTGTEKARALAESLLARHGIVTRETLRREDVPGGFTALYPVLRAMEEAGHVRRGYFVAGLGGAQFAYRGAEGRLRAAPQKESATVLAACDPANAYGSSLPWPRDGEKRFARSPGCFVILRTGRLIAYVGKSQRAWSLLLDGTDDEGAFVDAVAVWFGGNAERAWLIETIDGERATWRRRRSSSPAPCCAGWPGSTFSTPSRTGSSTAVGACGRSPRRSARWVL